MKSHSRGSLRNILNTLLWFASKMYRLGKVLLAWGRAPRFGLRLASSFGKLRAGCGHHRTRSRTCCRFSLCHAGRRRYQEPSRLHFVTFSCYRRQPNFSSGEVYDLFPECLERMHIAGAAAPILLPICGTAEALLLQGHSHTSDERTAGPSTTLGTTRVEIVLEWRTKSPPRQHQPEWGTLGASNLWLPTHSKRRNV